MSRYRILIAALLFFAGSAYANLQHCQLKVGWLDWPPYQYEDKHGAPQGFDIAIIKAIAQQTQCKIIFRKLTWMRQHVEAVNGKLDIILGVSPVGPLKHFVNSESFRSDPIGFYWFKGSRKHDPKSLVELLRYKTKLGVVHSYHRSKELEELMADTRYKRSFFTLQTLEGALKNLRKGRLDAAFLHIESANAILTSEPIQGLTLNKSLSFSTEVYIALALSSPLGKEFIININQSINTLKRNGTYKRLVDEHLNNQIHFK